MTSRASRQRSLPERPKPRKRYRDMDDQELNLAIRTHTAKAAMAFFDRLPAEERERVREGLSVVKGYTWQIQGRDAGGRFQPVSL